MGINFGRGRYACPGQFAESLGIKMVVAWLDTEYDSRFEEAKARPENLGILELMFQGLILGFLCGKDRLRDFQSHKWMSYVKFHPFN